MSLDDGTPTETVRPCASRSFARSPTTVRSLSTIEESGLTVTRMSRSATSAANVRIVRKARASRNVTAEVSSWTVDVTGVTLSYNSSANVWLAYVNGQLGAYSPGSPARDGFPEMMPRVTALAVRDGKIWAVWDVANPDKFSGSPLSAPSPPTEPGTRHRS